MSFMEETHRRKWITTGKIVKVLPHVTGKEFSPGHRGDRVWLRNQNIGIITGVTSEGSYTYCDVLLTSGIMIYTSQIQLENIDNLVESRMRKQ